MTMTTNGVIPSLSGLPVTEGSGSTAKDQPVMQSAHTQSPSGLVQDTPPESTTLQPASEQPAAKPNTNGIALGPRG